MKKKSPPYAIIGAVLLGLVAIALGLQWKKAQDQKTADALAKQQADLQAQIDALKAKPNAPVVVETNTNMRQVLYATQPVEPGIKISPAFYEKKSTPTDILPDAYSDQSDIIGWIAIRKIEKGDPLTPRNIGKSLPYMSQRLTPGMRLLALPIFNADANNTGGYVVDGDKVDLLYTTVARTQMVMQNLTVLSVPNSPVKTDTTGGVNPVAASGGAISVTFEVTPEQAQALVYLSTGLGGSNDTGKFSMILRARKDTTQPRIKPFEAADYQDNLTKIQTTTDTSLQRVKELSDKIADEEKKQGSGNTNETPTPPTP